MATDIEICSAALIALGDKAIAAFDEGTPRATQAANLYQHARREVLRSHNWNCCTRRVILAPETAKPAFDWRHQFARPDNWVRTIQVGYLGAPLEYVTEGVRILADCAVLPLVYVADVTEGEWDALLTGVMIKRMEVALAYAVTKSTTLADSLKQEFYRPGIGVLAQAKTIDGQENPPEDWSDSPFVQVRG